MDFDQIVWTRQADSVGRHREVSAIRAAEPRSNRGLPGWGLLTGVSAAAALLMVGVPLWISAAVAGSTVVLFLVFWQLSAALPPEPGAPDNTHGPSLSPGREADEDAAARARELYAADPEASRWTRTFGPPETGPLPILRYVEPSARHTPGQEQQLRVRRRQWSHSKR